VSTYPRVEERTVSDLDIFQCPNCQLPLEQNQHGMFCCNCGQVGKRDDMVLDFSTRDLYWSYIPRPLANQLVEAAKSEGSDAAFERVLASLDYKEFLARMLDERRGDFRFVLPASPGGCVLDLGSGWGANTLALSRQFQSVVAVDSTKENLRFTTCRIRDSGRSNVRFVCCDPLEGAQLPFREGVFDGVVLSGVLEWIGTGSREGSPRELQLRLLRYLKSLLKPEGCLYVGIENRFYALYWLGKKDPHAGVPFLPLLPKKAANAVSRLVRGEPYRTYIYSYRELDELLHEAGYSETEFYTPIPSYHEPRAVLPLAKKTYLSYWGRAIFLPRTYQQEVQVAALQTVNWLGSLPTLTADFAVVAGASKLHPVATYLWTTFKDRLSKSAGPEQLRVMKADDNTRESVSLLVFEGNAAVPAFRVKALRDPRNFGTLDREFHTLTSLREKLGETALRDSVPEPLARLDLDGFPILVTSVLPGKPLARLLPRNHLAFSRKRRSCHLVGRAVKWLLAFQTATRGELCLTMPPVEQLVEGLRDLKLDTAERRALVERAARAENVSCLGSAAHGDFAIANVLLNQDAIGVINWARAAENSQPLGDLLSLFLSAESWIDGVRFKQALHNLLARSSPLHDVFRASLAEYCRHFQLDPSLIPACFRAHALQRAEHAVRTGDRDLLAEQMNLVGSAFDDAEKMVGLVER
jgi:SAM-dependent methyltransferase